MNLKNIFVFPFCLLIIAGCANDAHKENTDFTQAQPKADVPDPVKTLFETKCGTCHGADGTAGIGNAANLQISRSDSTRIIQTIINGKGGMPPFKNTLSETEINQLEHYVHTLRK